eukprot:Cvel_22635.t1-p1 / transcript=Cvel_22635.t1 / gene=Cvel_22635 / organism=Chromera_velia_CCMP2878 / gene_product=hypothetical protein / transcript_product=hypothetical protein / location=Cvel_scaffold2246:728-802(-) / protein_length=25 / sequence_SO=supercontig / SO=protein_coding / is_pseudo=false
MKFLSAAFGGLCGLGLAGAQLFEAQ